MKRRRESDKIQDALIVVTSDGTRLRASLSSIGRDDEPRWILLEASGQQHIGPVATPDRSAEAVTALIEQWWKQHTSGD
jgi:hypothetical protein